MFAIDTTSEIPYTSDWMCGDFSKQTIINFHGFGEIIQDTSLIPLLDPLDKYNLSQNGRFDLPVYDVRLRGPPHHAINSILLGEDPLNWENWYFIEPQNDKEVIIGDWNMSDSSTVGICHTFLMYDEYFKKFIYLQFPFIEFKLTNGIPEMVWYEEGHVILQRPEVNSIKPASNSLETFVLNSNYPNPFNSNTKIEYSLPNFDKVKLQVYDITGKLVQTLVDENQNSGKYSVNFDGSNLPSGIYVYRLQVGSYSQTKKMVILK
jgi:hypothetical protein